MLGEGLDAPAVATLSERFAIRGRTGAGELSDPARAGGSLSADGRRHPASTSPRRHDRRSAATWAPSPQVSGDHNPIHTSDDAALLAGLGSPIVHGMWLSAAAQHVVTAVDRRDQDAAASLTAWTARFLGMVRPGDEIDVRVDRVGVDPGAEIVEVGCRVAVNW